MNVSACPACSKNLDKMSAHWFALIFALLTGEGSRLKRLHKRDMHLYAGPQLEHFEI